jgi:ABC-2 type transport system permease protein
MRLQTALVWELACKDLRLFLADRRGVLLCFAVPIVLASAFGAVFHRPGGPDNVRLPLLVVAEEGPLTRRVVAALCASDKVEASVVGRSEALERLAERRCGVAVLLPAGFDAAAALDRGAAVPCVQVLHAPGSDLEARWAEGLLTEVVLREAAVDLFGPLAPAGALRPPFAVERRAVAGPGGATFNTWSHSFCGMTLQYLLFWGMDSGLLLLRERRQGLWRRLRCAPVTLPTLLAGKALATALVALAQIGVVFGVGRLAFGVTVTGSAAGFLVLAVAAALLSAATGLVVAAVGGSEGRARSVSILVILTLSMLGGLWLPAFLLPGWARRLALALPTTWAAEGFEGVTWQGLGLAGALRCAGVLAGFSLTFLAVALWGFTRAEGRRTEGGTA